MAEDETALVIAWQQGDEQAIKTLFNLHYPRIVRLGVLSGLQRDEAQDCAQEAFLRSLECRNQLRDPAAFPLWFQRIATRHILNACKARQRHKHAILKDTDELGEDWTRTQIPQPDEIAIATESQEQLWQCVQALPPKYRVPLVLRYYGDHSLREVADLLEKREGTVRVLIHRALQRLRLSAQNITTTEHVLQQSNQKHALKTNQVYGG